jgi:hypothetical protein
VSGLGGISSFPPLGHWWDQGVAGADGRAGWSKKPEAWAPQVCGRVLGFCSVPPYQSTLWGHASAGPGLWDSALGGIARGVWHLMGGEPPEPRLPSMPIPIPGIGMGAQWDSAPAPVPAGQSPLTWVRRELQGRALSLCVARNLLPYKASAALEDKGTWLQVGLRPSRSGLQMSIQSSPAAEAAEVMPAPATRGRQSSTHSSAGPWECPRGTRSYPSRCSQGPPSVIIPVPWHGGRGRPQGALRGQVVSCRSSRGW